MLDKPVRKIIDPILSGMVHWLVPRSVTPNMVTGVGFLFGVAACVAVAYGELTAALALLAINRIADGLDGALARKTVVTDLGGYLDIMLDFLFYGGYVFAFAVLNPDAGIYAAFLIFAFIGTGTSFLTNALFMEKHRGAIPVQQRKSFFYIGGLAEGTETIAVFVLMTLFPAYFPAIAVVFGSVCWITTIMRIIETALILRGK